MKNIILAIMFLAALFVDVGQTNGRLRFAGEVAAQSDPIASAFSEQRSGVRVTGRGMVVRMLSDDNDGDRHQRFILRLPSGQTLLIAHNIDLAPRLDALRVGDVVEFSGVYEWNEKGGVIHWTHHDPGGRHPAGWLRCGGRLFQ